MVGNVQRILFGVEVARGLLIGDRGRRHASSYFPRQSLSVLYVRMQFNEIRTVLPVLLETPAHEIHEKWRRLFVALAEVGLQAFQSGPPGLQNAGLRKVLGPIVLFRYIGSGFL